MTNPGTKFIDVVAACRNSVGSTYIPTSNDCTGVPLEGGFTCTVGLGAGQGGFCTLDSSSAKVRAAINVLDHPTSIGAPLVDVIPATK